MTHVESFKQILAAGPKLVFSNDEADALARATQQVCMQVLDLAVGFKNPLAALQVLCVTMMEIGYQMRTTEVPSSEIADLEKLFTLEDTREEN